MASNVKLQNIGVIGCETRHEGGEWVVYYSDPDGTPGVQDRFGGGAHHKTSGRVVAALAQDLRKRGYTGSLKNLKPAQATKKGVAA